MVNINGNKFGTILESTTDCILVWDKDYNYLYANQAAIDHIGTTRDKVIGKTIHEGLGHISDFVHLWMSRIDKVIETGEPLQVEDQVPVEDKLVRSQSSLSLIANDKGEIVAVSVVYCDVTELKDAQATLEFEQNQLISIFDSIDEAIYACDLDTHEVLYINKYLKDAFGKDLIGGIYYEAFQGFDKSCEFCTNDKIWELDGKPYRWEYHNPVLNQDYIIKDIIIKWPDGRDVRFEIAIDIATERQAQRELKEAQEKMMKQERLATLGKLGGGIGHELRNPLAAIKNSVYLLKMILTNTESDVKEALDIIEKEVHTSERIINGLLEYTRPKSSTQQKFKVTEVIEEFLTKMQIPENILIKINLGENIPVFIADPMQMMQVFSNICLNAFQAMPDGGASTINSELTGDEWLSIAFKDTGVGIAEENQRKLFEPLFTTKPKGIGLGLSIVKIIVEAHGGKIDAKREVGRGTTFTVKLPPPKERMT